VDVQSLSVYMTALFRVNLALRLHDETLYRVVPSSLGSSRVFFPLSAASSLGSAKDKEIQKNSIKLWKNIRYNLRLFAFTHLDLLQRMKDLKSFENTSIYQRVPRGRNYALRHYDEVYPFAALMTHQGMLPNFAGIVH